MSPVNFHRAFARWYSEIERHWQELAGRRRAYSWLISICLLITVAGSLWFANEFECG